jgi:hypothetical protein
MDLKVNLAFTPKYRTHLHRCLFIYNLNSADTDTDTDISVLANGISVSAISVSVSVSANLDIGYIGIGQISAKIQGYWPKYRHISAKS